VANETRLPNGLTQRQFAFYNLLIEQMNEAGKMDAKQAAISAGYCSTSASRIATRLLKKPEGQAYLKSLQVKSIHSATVTIDWIMEKLVWMVRAGIADDGSINYNALPCSIRAISEINKIKGYYAPEKKFNLDMTMDDIQEAKAKELARKYTRAY
jgi:phage terminase small subunit